MPRNLARERHNTFWSNKILVKPSKPVVLTEGKVKLQKLSVMANYATNLFFASTENESDLDKIEAFLDDKFGVCYQDRNDDCIEAEFESRWDYPEELIEQLIASLEAKDEIYIRVLTHELCNEYVSFRIFSGGEWDIRY